MAAAKPIGRVADLVLLQEPPIRGGVSILEADLPRCLGVAVEMICLPYSGAHHAAILGVGWGFCWPLRRVALGKLANADRHALGECEEAPIEIADKPTHSTDGTFRSLHCVLVGPLTEQGDHCAVASLDDLLG